MLEKTEISCTGIKYVWASLNDRAYKQTATSSPESIMATLTPISSSIAKPPKPKLRLPPSRSAILEASAPNKPSTSGPSAVVSTNAVICTSTPNNA